MLNATDEEFSYVIEAHYKLNIGGQSADFPLGELSHYTALPWHPPAVRSTLRHLQSEVRAAYDAYNDDRLELCLIAWATACWLARKDELRRLAPALPDPGITLPANGRDFHVDLNFSNQAPVVQGIVNAAFRHFPGLLAVHVAHRVNDKKGADYILEFPGRTEWLDAKTRRQDYALRGDRRTCTVEWLSNISKGSPGWSVDPEKITDQVLYYFAESGRSEAFNAHDLRRAVIHFKADLLRVGKSTPQTTQAGQGSYHSESTFVEAGHLRYAIKQIRLLSDLSGISPTTPKE